MAARFKVVNERNGHEHIVTFLGDEAQCDCKDFWMRRVQRGEYCKHIRFAIKKLLSQKYENKNKKER